MMKGTRTLVTILGTLAFLASFEAKAALIGGYYWEAFSYQPGATFRLFIGPYAPTNKIIGCDYWPEWGPVIEGPLSPDLIGKCWTVDSGQAYDIAVESLTNGELDSLSYMCSFHGEGGPESWFWTAYMVDQHHHVTSYYAGTNGVDFAGFTIDHIAFRIYEAWNGGAGMAIEVFGDPIGNVIKHTITISSTPGGSVSSPGEGSFEYDEGTSIPIHAVAQTDYYFAGWTGTTVDAGKIANPNSPSIALTADGDYTLVANFRAIEGFQRMLGIISTPGGRVEAPGEGSFVYVDGAFVPVIARADTGYEFTGWAGTAAEAGAVLDPTAASTEVKVDANYGLCANFFPAGSQPLHLVSPNGGEILTSGSAFVMHWEALDPVSHANIELSTDGGTTWTRVAASATGRQYDWQVPLVDSDRCLVRITAADNTLLSDTSDAPFSIRMHAADGHTWYVDAAAATGGDGTSWETAFVCLQDGLTSAAAGDCIWVAEGLYWPDLGAGQIAGNRSATFRLKNGVIICGGFPAGGGTWQQRNPFWHQSTLSGNLGEPEKTGDNSYHVVDASGTDKTAVLDGCTVAAGFANGAAQDRGAGLYNLRGSPQVRNCIFVGNAAAGDGGGAWNSQSNATFVNCVFNGNTAGNNGGGLYSEQGDVAITNCTFAANEATWRAGGVFNASGTAEVVNCILWNNSRMGGVSYDELAQVSGDPKPTLSYCCVQGWTGSLGGQNSFGRDPLFLDTDGADNVAGTSDDDLRLQAGSPCIDKGDNAAVPPEVVADQQGDPRIISNAVDMGAYEFGAMPAPSETGGP
jgi:predicted outer membrane repeat protein